MQGSESWHSKWGKT